MKNKKMTDEDVWKYAREHIDVWKYARAKDAKDAKRTLDEIFCAPTITKMRNAPGLSKEMRGVMSGFMFYMEFMMAVSYQVIESGLKGGEAKSALLGLMNDPSLLNEHLDGLVFPVTDYDAEMVTKMAKALDRKK